QRHPTLYEGGGTPVEPPLPSQRLKPYQGFSGFNTGRLSMSLDSITFRSAVLALPIVMLAATQSSAQGAGPFSGMAGAWNGTGAISLASGNRERIRCRATYDVNEAGDNLKLDLRCASDSYKFSLSGNAQSSGGNVTGNWFESTRAVGGNIS